MKQPTLNLGRLTVRSTNGMCLVKLVASAWFEWRRFGIMHIFRSFLSIRVYESNVSNNYGIRQIFIIHKVNTRKGGVPAAGWSSSNIRLSNRHKYDGIFAQQHSIAIRVRLMTIIFIQLASDDQVYLIPMLYCFD